MEDEVYEVPTCPYCHKECRTRRGVEQHLNFSPECRQKRLAEVSCRKPAQEQGNPDTEEEENETTEASGSRTSKRAKRGVRGQSRNRTGSLQNHSDFGSGNEEPENGNPGRNEGYPSDAEEDPSDNDQNGFYGYGESDQEDAYMDEGAANPDDGNEQEPQPNTEFQEAFRQYVEEHPTQHLRLTNAEKTSIRLLEVLKQKKTPLNAFPEVLEWHLKEIGHLESYETLGDTEHYTHRAPLLDKLMKRYNLEGMEPVEKKVTLPSSKVVASIPCRDALECIISILTDPRLQDDDYLFWGDNPFAPPPETVDYLEDLNTGEAYLKTYKEMITKPNQILLMVPMYIDGATTGQFSDLPITPLKLTLGILKRETREKAWAWRELGWIPQIRKQRARGKKILVESNHLESQDVALERGEGDVDSELDSTDGDDEVVESDDNEDEDTDVKAQDFHTMLSTILASFVDLQRTGFKFDFVWRGKVYKDAEFVVVVPFIKCDTEEGDLLCGKYLCRTGNVKHICRYCHTPSEKADDPLAKIKLKTQPYIQNLVEKGNLERLQQISQQYINNAWYKVTFHKANECGIHGACPSEMLHALLLGIFKYVRDIFFKYMGTSSQLAEDIDGLAKEYGRFLNHQSNRDKPDTNFSKGISQGKLMATQYRGVLLIMASVLRSTKGRELLMKRRRFGKEKGIQDWSMLVELLLEWETYLCEKKMRRDHVKKLKQKHKVIMHLLKQVSKRKKGRGWKLMKFHAVLHLVADVLLYGVPKQVDTGSNESHHKPSKYAARVTQRKESTFNMQTAKRLTEFLCIELAMMEVEEGVCVWEYFLRAEERDPEAQVVESEDQDEESHEVDVQTKTGGTRLVIYEDEERDNRPTLKMLGRSKYRKLAKMDRELLVFLNDLQHKVLEYIPEEELQVYTEHHRNKVTFRANPHYRGNGSWRDWALVEWVGYGVLPCKIWCFVELSQLPKGRNAIEHGGVDLKDGVYAVVECGEYVEEEDDIVQSDIFRPLELEMEGEIVFPKKKKHQPKPPPPELPPRKFYLADVEAFKGPLIVVPDIGGDPNRYFQVKGRTEWKEDFVKWLGQPHKLDEDIEEEGDEVVESNNARSKKRKRRSKK